MAGLSVNQPSPSLRTNTRSSFVALRKTTLLVKSSSRAFSGFITGLVTGALGGAVAGAAAGAVTGAIIAAFTGIVIGITTSTTVNRENTENRKCSVEQSSASKNQYKSSEWYYPLFTNPSGPDYGQHEQDPDIASPPRSTKNDYVIVLMDGDGLRFKRRYINQGIAGGGMAALGLYEKVHSIHKDVRIEAKIIANRDELAFVMSSCHETSSTEVSKEFFLGFTRAVPSFEFIDVGPGKELADWRIADLAKWHNNMPQCRHIYLGISHDSGYQSLLRELVTTSSRVKCTIIEGSPTVPALELPEIPILDWTDKLFCDYKLPGKDTKRRNSHATTSPNQNKTAYKGQSSPTIVASFGYPPPAEKTHPNQKRVSPETEHQPVPVHTNKPACEADFRSYRDVLTSSVSPESQHVGLHACEARTTVLGNTQETEWSTKPTKGFTGWKNQLRKQDPTTVYDKAQQNKIKKILKKRELCYEFSFYEGCSRDPRCKFEHRRLTEPQKKALEHKLRTIPCELGQECDKLDCVNGHHCSAMEGNKCVRPSCPFVNDQHPPGTQYSGKRPETH